MNALFMLEASDDPPPQPPPHRAASAKDAVEEVYTAKAKPMPPVLTAEDLISRGTANLPPPCASGKAKPPRRFALTGPLALVQGPNPPIRVLGAARAKEYRLRAAPASAASMLQGPVFDMFQAQQAAPLGEIRMPAAVSAIAAPPT